MPKKYETGATAAAKSGKLTSANIDSFLRPTS